MAEISGTRWRVAFRHRGIVPALAGLAVLGVVGGWLAIAERRVPVELVNLTGETLSEVVVTFARQPEVLALDAAGGTRPRRLVLAESAFRETATQLGPTHRLQSWIPGSAIDCVQVEYLDGSGQPRVTILSAPSSPTGSWKHVQLSLNPDSEFRSFWVGETTLSARIRLSLDLLVSRLGQLAVSPL